MEIYVGTSGYSYKEWIGKFYPGKISPKEMLHFYSQRIGTVEINNTFYRMPTESILMSWAEQVPADFVFAFKAPRIVTHLKRLIDVDEEVKHLFRTLPILKDKLGPVLFQFPKSFHAELPVLKYFLTLIPGQVSCAFEFRHPSWLEGKILDILRERGCSLCIADTDENPVQEIITTANWGYLRLRRSDYSSADLSQWMDIILAQKWERAFVFFKHEEEAEGAETAMRFREIINEKYKMKRRKKTWQV